MCGALKFDWCFSSCPILSSSPLPISSMSSEQTAVASSSNPAEILKTATFSRQHNVSGEQPITASDLLMAAYDPSKLHPLADLSDKLDYLLLDDDKTSELPGARTAIPSRGWSDDLCYGTGTMYLSGKLDLFQLTLFEQYNMLWPPFLLGLNSPYLDVHPTLDSLLFLFYHMFILLFYRTGHRRSLGSTRGR
jgi:hypothetical protein